MRRAAQAEELQFRGKPIKWVVGSKSYNKKVTDPITCEITKETRTRKVNLISYEGQEYEREAFLTAMFPDYKKYDYTVKFLTDNVFWLGGTPRDKLMYLILSRHYSLVEVAEQDKRDLEQIAAKNKDKTYQTWYRRMQWENGHELLMTFGAAKEVRGAAKGVYCYSQDITDTQAAFTGVNMTWGEWIRPLKEYLDMHRERIAAISDEQKRQRAVEYICDNDMMCMYYQKIGKEEIRLTLPAVVSDKIKEWIDKYLADEKAEFPYSGEIPNSDVAFTIDFEKDVEIVKSHAGVSESNTRRGQVTAANNADDLPDGELSRQEIIRLKGKGKFDRMAEHGEIVKVKGRYGYWQRKKE